ncbi:hypothetical protein SAMN04487766_1278 [Actinomyces ruminicola]|uniref:Uncharacterized protein n=1 Tax=Actinomyces ruminicola TaxID=332524 RepID=A0A1H0AJY0_9ACTO|nr:hypothetical protein SAMN04487766_1278 [Actinomyces ruminicola]
MMTQRRDLSGIGSVSTTYRHRRVAPHPHQHAENPLTTPYPATDFAEPLRLDPIAYEPFTREVVTR